MSSRHLLIIYIVLCHSLLCSHSFTSVVLRSSHHASLRLSSLTQTRQTHSTLLSSPQFPSTPPPPSPTNSTGLVSLLTLQTYFGPNSNKIWGDLTNSDTRLLYHSLLPRALLKIKTLHNATDADTDLKKLAYLSYSLRQTAKLYSRYRCNLPGRVLTEIYDGWRHFREYGKWNTEGREWDEIWEKYSLEINSELTSPLPPSEISDLICLRILERSCSTNSLIDSYVFSSDNIEALTLQEDLITDEMVDTFVEGVLDSERTLSAGEEVVIMLAQEDKEEEEEEEECTIEEEEEGKCGRGLKAKQISRLRKKVERMTEKRRRVRKEQRQKRRKEEGFE
ncbi:hypothetical protein TrVE_jg4849 [Triparma verrucosa]|uniref:Uncharacterized protein n=1 Tax=Triparma verrucosa TaxID=1606542 RepID=A0A9W6ZC33_9STRA|nr:hypothetical protein TrVE_jg4849 [Triparma verrucosa]